MVRAAGDLLTRGANVYTWDAANRLAAAGVDGVVRAYEYDGLGNRVVQTVDGVKLNMCWTVRQSSPQA
jgi:hypothetical protein